MVFNNTCLIIIISERYGLLVPLHGVCMGGVSMGDLLADKTGERDK